MGRHPARTMSDTPRGWRWRHGEARPVRGLRPSELCGVAANGIRIVPRRPWGSVNFRPPWGSVNFRPPWGSVAGGGTGRSGWGHEPYHDPHRDAGRLAAATRWASLSGRGVMPSTAPRARRGADRRRLVLNDLGVLGPNAASNVARPLPPGGPSPAGWSRSSCTRSSRPSAPAGPSRRNAPARR